MNRRTLLVSAPAALLGGCASTAGRAMLAQQVMATEQAFAATMALRGRAAIVAHWRPDRVAVLDSGDLAYSTGPVAAPDGKVFARFYSTWRRERSGAWRIIFDDGCSLGECR